ncbi:ABC transporter permease [Tanticharoenia sakaeratensis]|jgi:capsular polysaccharide transport system permease protein|uniref:ABC-2 type transporter n=1 Tax=Tanticharoenia sakaeratensis NBRC 103193 TaxID=1231623 RepID=A0A0D6MMA1_9PROT|nr:ABC transporter permease [Tanticharoenia sakaeratensis]GAN54799.1 ABC-2 type transporter [Tanticharoenia sakaeratensis NBRC 103193]GBQ21524.1 capsular polysaccharide ABC transporter transmembrane protein [Tanticharoenia sakaeratensis NBRC 103193]
MRGIGQRLRASFQIQIRVIGALMMRELHTRFGRENLGYLWIVGEPILFCAGVAIAWTAIRPAHDHGLQTTAVVVTGYVPLTMWRHCLMSSIRAFEANGSLLYHRQVTPLDIIAARSALEIMGTLMAGLIVASGAILIGYMEPPKDIGLLYAGILFQCAFSFATALLVAALSQRSELVEKSVGVFSYLSLPFSGAFSICAWLPERARNLMLWSPSVNNIEMIRGGQFGDTMHPYYSMTYDAYATSIMIMIGLSLTLRVRKFIRVE